MSGQDDAALVAQSVRGDERAFAKLIRRYERPLTTLIRYEVSDAHQAEDVWQEVLLVAGQALGQLRSAGNVRSWLMRIARNQCLAFHRSKHRRDVPTQADALERLVCRHGVAAARREATQAAMGAIAAAAPAHRGILQQFYIDGFTIAEIAARHRLPTGTVKRRLHTARKQLRQSLGVQPATRSTSMTTATTPHPFPDRRPPIAIRPLAQAARSVDCGELRWWHIVPEVGDHSLCASYNAPDWSLAQTTELRVLGPAEVHGLQGVKIAVQERTPGGSPPHQTLAMYGRLTEGETQWLAVAGRAGDREHLATFLDENFALDWGGPLPRRIADEGLFAERAPGSFETTGQAAVEGGAGSFSVSISGRAFACLRVFDLDLADGVAGDEAGTLIEAYLTQDGRTLLFRRYNGRLWGRDTKVPWDERFPDNARIVVDGATYVHWYDQIHARAFQRQGGSD